MEGFDVEGARALTLDVGDLKFSAWATGEGPLVVLIHGFPDGPETFRHQLPALAAAGYRAVAVTSRGYEVSSQPPSGNYSIAELSNDVLGWMDALGAEKAHLVGHDWGANLAFAAARAAPERVLSLTLIAVPHPARVGEQIRSDRAQRRRSSYIFFFMAPVISEAWVGFAQAAFVERLWRRWSPGWRFEANVIGQVRRRFSDRAVVRAALSYYRQVGRPPPKDAARVAELFGGVQEVRTLGITGELDQCIGVEVFDRCMRSDDFRSKMRVERVAGAGHFAHQEQPDVVNTLLLDWIGAAG